MALASTVNSGFEQLLGPGPKATEDALYKNSEADILRQYQGNRETAYGRGLGISTIAAQINRTRDLALEQAQRDAFLAGQQAQTSALAQAANVVAGNQQRAQQEGQFNRAQSQQKNLANQQMIGQGVGGLVGAGANFAGRVIGPGGFKGLFGGGPSAPAVTAPSGYAPTLAQGNEDYGAPPLNTSITQPSMDMGGSGGAMPSFSGLGAGSDFSTPNFGSSGSNFSIPDLNGGGFDFSSLSNPFLRDLGTAD